MVVFPAHTHIHTHTNTNIHTQTHIRTPATSTSARVQTTKGEQRLTRQTRPYVPWILVLLPSRKKVQNAAGITFFANIFFLLLLGCSVWGVGLVPGTSVRNEGYCYV